MILCANPRCRSLGRHHPDCEGECRGCLPRMAADGRNLCEVCTRRLAEDARTAGELHHALGNVLVTHGRGISVSGTKDPGLDLDPRAVECRTLIRAQLVSWSLLIAEERGFETPQDTPRAMGGFIATNSVWLSAHPAANDASEELHDLAHGRPLRVAYPSGMRHYPVGNCPRCEGTISATIRDTDALLPSTLACDLDEEHVWTADTWRSLGRALHPRGLSDYISSLEVSAIWRLPMGTVHWLASRDAWPRIAGRPTQYLAEAVNLTMSKRVRRTA